MTSLFGGGGVGTSQSDLSSLIPQFEDLSGQAAAMQPQFEAFGNTQFGQGQNDIYPTALAQFQAGATGQLTPSEQAAVNQSKQQMQLANTGTYAKSWWWYYGLTAQQLQNYYTANDARLVSVEPYVVGGTTYFAAIMLHNVGADYSGWWWYYGLTPAQIQTHLTANKARLIDLRQYTSGTSTVYGVVMVPNTGSSQSGWWWYYGITPAQLATFPNSTIRLDYGLTPPSITFGGNPGISAGIKDDLASIIGKPVTIPIYDTNGGNGNNAWYRVVQFASVRILSVNFQGNPKYVIVQPALQNDPSAIPGTPLTSWTSGGLVRVHLAR